MHSMAEHTHLKLEIVLVRYCGTQSSCIKIPLLRTAKYQAENIQEANGTRACTLSRLADFRCV